MKTPPSEIGALLGRELKDRYLLTEVLGWGGMGAVFKSHDRVLERPVAVKVILPSLAQDEETWKQLLARFAREARITANLQHPNVVSVLDYGQDGDTPFLVMELLEGRDLEQLLKGARRLPAARAVRILSQVCSAIDAAHRKKQIHRDLKPSNIFLCEEPDRTDVVKVVDFGLARDAPGSPGPGGGESLTRTGVVIGTAYYISPEQIEPHPSRRVDARCDIYQLGCVAYRMLSGRLPFTGRTLLAIFQAHVNRKADPLLRLVPDLPPGLSEAVEKAMAKRADDRFQTMTEMRIALEAAVRARSAGRGEMPQEPRANVPGSREGKPFVPADNGKSPPSSPGGSDDPTFLVGSTGRAAGAPSRGEVSGESPETSPMAVPSPFDNIAQTPRIDIDVRSRPIETDGLLRPCRLVLARSGASNLLLFEATVSGRTQVVACPVADDGSSAGRQRVLSAASRSARFPSAEVGADGILRVAWIEASPGLCLTRVVGRAFDAAGNPCGEARVLSEPALAGAPCLAVLPGGKVVVAWHEAGTEPVIRAVICEPDMTPSVPPTMVSTGFQPTVASGAEGAMIAWTSASGEGIRYCALRQRRSGGVPVSSGVFPRLVAGVRDVAALWWWSPRTPEAAQGFGHVRDPGADGDALAILQDPAAMPAGLAVSTAGTGFMAAWGREPAREGEGSRVVATLVSDRPGVVSERVVLDECGASPPALADLGDGHVLAAWCAGEQWRTEVRTARLAWSLG